MHSNRSYFLRSVELLALCATFACARSETDPAHPAQDATREDALARTRKDADGDGYNRAPWGKDCDDSRAWVHPGATETCSTSYDDDCDGVTNEKNAASCTTFQADADGDGYGSSTSSACYCSASGVYDTKDTTDCNDASGSVYPGATEIAGDGIDQDCDGVDLSSGSSGGGSSGGGGTDTGDAPLYGFWSLDGYLTSSGLADVKSRTGMNVVQLACGSPSYCVGTVLPLLKSAGVHATFRMTGSHSNYTNSSGDFDLAAWKTQLAKWSGSGVQAYIDDGTLVGHMVLDDISNFSGKDATAADLDEMARYSKSIMPGLMTYARERATAMPTPSSGTYTYLDACVNQYRVAHGEIHTYVSAQEAKAKSLNLGVINGLNLPDGGDGSSGQPGWRTDGTFWAMSAAEITEYGEALAAMPSMGMFLSWEYDGVEQWSDGTIGADYLRQPDVQKALADLAVVVKAHPHVTLLKP